MKRCVFYILISLFAIFIVTSCDFRSSSDNEVSPEVKQYWDAVEREKRIKDSIAFEKKMQAIHEMLEREEKGQKSKGKSKSRTIVKEPTDGKQMYEDAMVGFDRYEDIDDDDDMRGFMEENDW